MKKIVAGGLSALLICLCACSAPGDSVVSEPQASSVSQSSSIAHDDSSMIEESIPMLSFETMVLGTTGDLSFLTNTSWEKHLLTSRFSSTVRCLAPHCRECGLYNYTYYYMALVEGVEYDEPTQHRSTGVMDSDFNILFEASEERNYQGWSHDNNYIKISSYRAPEDERGYYDFEGNYLFGPDELPEGYEYIDIESDTIEAGSYNRYSAYGLTYELIEDEENHSVITVFAPDGDTEVYTGRAEMDYLTPYYVQFQWEDKLVSFDLYGNASLDAVEAYGFRLEQQGDTYKIFNADNIKLMELDMPEYGVYPALGADKKGFIPVNESYALVYVATDEGNYYTILDNEGTLYSDYKYSDIILLPDGNFIGLAYYDFATLRENIEPNYKDYFLEVRGLTEVEFDEKVGRLEDNELETMMDYCTLPIEYNHVAVTLN
ncbi:hypothetical protein LJC04_02160 [Ruminococcaceae bacterium OttesenSCG-928-O06]|nr:hypothetical protein [Ruminococcaceae bacterium OttesenSCG-928-O06]